MSVKEYRRWVKFRNARGSLYTPRRLEQSVAKLCALMTGIMGIKKDSDLDVPFSELDFSPHEDGYLTRNDELNVESWVAKELAAEKKSASPKNKQSSLD